MLLRSGSSICLDRRTTAPRRAFTLIEVLVVVAIIALLVSILLPSLSRARAQAKVLACRANLHDLGNSFTMYADQYKGYFPINKDNIVDGFQGVWDSRLMKNPQILVCPSTQNIVRNNTVRKPTNAGDYAHATLFPEDPTNFYVPYVSGSDIRDHALKGATDSSGGHSYEYMSGYKTANLTSAQWARRRQIALPVSTSEILLVNDEDDAQPTLGGSKGCENSTSTDGNNCPQPWDNHGAEGMNMMFMDGHAQFVRKVAGLFRDYSKTPIVSRQDDNASIDMIWQKSTAPYLFGK